MCGYAHLSVGALRDWKVSDPLDLESHMVMSHLMGVLGVELGSFARIVSVLNHSKSLFLGLKWVSYRQHVLELL